MWKKWLSALLCALMLLSGALAEEADAAWRVTVSDVQISRGGETAVLDLSLEALIGREDGGYWLQLSALQGGESALAVQAQYADNTLAATVDGAQDCLIVNEAGVFFEQYGLSAEAVDRALDEIFAALGADPAAYLERESVQDALGTSVSVEALSDSSYRVEVEIAGVAAALTLSWSPWTDGVAFDLSQKNACTYTYREAFPGEGTDIVSAATDAVARLMQDATLVEAAGVLFGAQWMQTAAE